MQEQAVSAITFKEVKKLVAKGFGDSKLVDAVDKLLGAVLLISAATGAGTPALGLIGAKNELIKLGQGAAKKIISKTGGDFLDRSRRMAAAHCLITYTAFFEALHRELPDLMKAVALSAKEQQAITTEALCNAPRPADAADGEPNNLAEVPIVLPHPVADPGKETATRHVLYRRLTDGFARFLTGLSVWEQADERVRNKIKEALGKLPELTCEVYQAQYLALAMEYPQFFVWADPHEQAKARKLTGQLSAEVRQQAAQVENLAKSVDLGLRRLAETINAVDTASTSVTPDEVALALNRIYEAQVTRRIIEDPYEDSGETTLAYPLKTDIFVPQAFKAIRYAGPQIRLEDENLWAEINPQDGLGAILVRYLQSVYSTETPLLVLGHPGSGKSLLTEIIAARLAPPDFNTVRVELRDIKPDTGLQTQLEEQIRADTKVVLAPKREIVTPPRGSRLEDVLTVSEALEEIGDESTLQQVEAALRR